MDESGGVVAQAEPIALAGLADPTIAVIAHTLLTDVALVGGVLRLLRDEWDDLDDDRRREFVALGLEQSHRMRAVVDSLVRGLPAEALRLLEESIVNRKRRR